MNNFIKVCIIFFSLSSLFSCKKELKDSSIIVNSDQTKNNIVPYNFNWETAEFMPAPPGTINPPRVPWSSFSNQGFSQDIRYDYKKSDGWQLVYNTFSPTRIDLPKSMVLYNKYRGLIRYYLYIDPYNVPAPSDYIVHSLKLEAINGATSSLLNFAGKDAINLSSNTNQVSQIINYKVNSTSGWYAFDFELAYDPSITLKTIQDLNLRWTAGSVSVTQVDLSGQLNGTLKGTIGIPSAPPSFFGQAVKGVVTITGLSVLSNNPTLFPSKVQEAVTSALKDGLQGVIKNLFSAIFGGNSNNVQQVSLDINTTIKLTGTATTPSGLMDNVFVIPGISNSQTTIGYSPLYNTPLGVFNLSSKPKIKYTQTLVPQPPNTRGDYYKYRFTIDPNSYQLLFNPAVTSSATISNIKTSIICLNPSLYYEVNGIAETVGDMAIKSNVSYIVSKETLLTNKFALRISFNVNYGGPKPVTIIKTFLATVAP